MGRGDKSGTKEIDFYYDHNGMRTRKVVRENGREETTDYTLHSKLITHLTKGSVDAYGNESYDHLHFFYDAQSKPAFVEYRGEMYRYIHNLQGDIIGIVDANGTLVVEYKYDAWGKPVSMTGSFSTTLGILNPFRYRGYVWDSEMRFNYLRSRYYSYCFNRFINADSFVATEWKPGNNVFSYCCNDIINRIDSNGKASRSFATQIPLIRRFTIINFKDLFDWKKIIKRPLGVTSSTSNEQKLNVNKINVLNIIKVKWGQKTVVTRNILGSANSRFVIDFNIDGSDIGIGSSMNIIVNGISGSSLFGISSSGLEIGQTNSLGNSYVSGGISLNKDDFSVGLHSDFMKKEENLEAGFYCEAEIDGSAIVAALSIIFWGVPFPLPA